MDNTLQKTIVYRLATLKDMATLIDYRIILLKAVGKTLPLTREAELRKTLKKYYTKHIGNKTCFSYIAEHKNNFVGFGTFVLRHQPGNFSTITGKTAYILNMYTLPPYRGLGIATGILERMMVKAKKLSVKRVELRASKMGEPIYRKFGFREPQTKVMEMSLDN
jgi:GNAT superfamily N-acetyltransferase